MTDLQILNYIKHKFKVSLRYVRISAQNEDKMVQRYFQGYCDACFELYHLIKNQMEKEIEEMENQENGK